MSPACYSGTSIFSAAPLSFPLQRVTQLHEVLRQLPLKCCTAVVLEYRHGLSYAEIAERLKISRHMLKKRGCAAKSQEWERRNLGLWTEVESRPRG